MKLPKTFHFKNRVTDFRFPARLNKANGLLFILAFAVIGSVLLFTTRAATPPASLEPEQGAKAAQATVGSDNVASGGQYIQFGNALEATRIGVYTGPADVTGHTNFASSLGVPVPYAVQFLDYRQGWEIDFTTNWLLEPWGNWVSAVPGRRLILSVPMLENSDPGVAGLNRGNNGDFDQYFRGLAENMVSKGLGNSIIRLGWESNGNWYAWSAGPGVTAWKAYYRRIVGVMRAVPGQSFQFDWNRANGPAGTNLSYADHYPGDDVVDIISLDAYDAMYQDTTSSPEVRWNFVLNQAYGLNAFRDFAVARGKPMAIPEWGLWKTGNDIGGAGDNPYYIDKMADWFRDNRPLYQAYFNSNDDGEEHELSRYPNGNSRYRARFGP